MYLLIVSSFYSFKIIFNVSEYLSTCMYVSHVCAEACGDQRRASDLLKLL